jgi:hypothetical protein
MIDLKFFIEFTPFSLEWIPESIPNPSNFKGIVPGMIARKNDVSAYRGFEVGLEDLS